MSPVISVEILINNPRFMKILVQQIKTVLVEFVSTLEGSREEKEDRWRAAVGTIWQSTRDYEMEYPDRKDMNIFDFAWTKCDVSYKDLAKKFNTSEGAIKLSLFRVRQHVKERIELSD